MSRAVTSAFTGQMVSLDPKPRILVEIATGSTTTPWIRMTSNDADEVWPTGGSTFTARPFEIEGPTISASEFPGIVLRCADADNYFDTWLLTTNFRNKKLRRFVIEQDATATSTAAICDVFRIQKRDRVDGEFVFTAVPLQEMLGEYRLPRRSISRADFPGLPKEGVVI